MKHFVARGKPAEISQLARSFTKSLSHNFEKTAILESEIFTLEAKLPDLIKARKFTECAKIQSLIDEKRKGSEEDPVVASLGKLLNVGGKGENPNDTSYLSVYENIPLNEYVDDGNFWHINKKYTHNPTLPHPLNLPCFDRLYRTYYYEVRGITLLSSRSTCCHPIFSSLENSKLLDI